MVDAIVADLAEQAKVVVLIIEDLHELSSAAALTQLAVLMLEPQPAESAADVAGTAGNR